AWQNAVGAAECGIAHGCLAQRQRRFGADRRISNDCEISRAGIPSPLRRPECISAPRSFHRGASHGMGSVWRLSTVRGCLDALAQYPDGTAAYPVDRNDCGAITAMVHVRSAALTSPF